MMGDQEPGMRFFHPRRRDFFTTMAEGLNIYDYAFNQFVKSRVPGGDSAVFVWEKPEGGWEIRAAPPTDPISVKDATVAIIDWSFAGEDEEDC